MYGTLKTSDVKRRNVQFKIIKPEVFTSRLISEALFVAAEGPVSKAAGPPRF